jgi:hypothetical protein
MKKEIKKELQNLNLRELRERQEQLQQDMENIFPATEAVYNKVKDEVTALFKGVAVPRESVYMSEGSLQVANFIGIQNGVIIEANNVLPETITAVVAIYNKYLS